MPALLLSLLTSLFLLFSSVSLCYIILAVPMCVFCWKHWCMCSAFALSPAELYIFFKETRWSKSRLPNTNNNNNWVVMSTFVCLQGFYCLSQGIRVTECDFWLVGGWKIFYFLILQVYFIFWLFNFSMFVFDHFSSAHMLYLFLLYLIRF